jgi:hypothetical protein
VKLKDRASFFSFFLEKPLYEVCLIRIKEQVSEKRSTVCTHKYADCLLKNTSTKHNQYVVNQNLEHADDISFRELFGRIGVVFARSFNFTFRYIDDVLSLNNSRFGDFVDGIYPNELEIKDTIDTDRSASYLDLNPEIDSEGRLRTKLYDKRDDFNFPIVNFPEL